uniref:Anoctamin-6-like n=1 Tax=Camelus bactrianus TaxID=9837 RepID=A0A9W3H018_CAMBA|nr:anoctamin-6-like [Camelus bactrianus]
MAGSLHVTQNAGIASEICHPSHAFTVGWEGSQSESALWNVLDDKLVFAKVHTLWEVLCTYAEILHIKLPLKPSDLETWLSAFDNFGCYMEVLQVDESIIKPEQEFFIALFEKSCVNDFYIQDRDTFFNPAIGSCICNFSLRQRTSAAPANTTFCTGNGLLEA